MKWSFYDVKAKAKVKAEVTAKVKIEKNGRYAFKAVTEDGRSLTAFVKEADWLKADVAEPKACAKGGCGCKGKKK